LARIRQGNIDKKESVSISDIIHNYEIAFSMGKKKNGVMEYYQPLVLSDGTTTVSAIQLLFSDNIVKINPVPLPPAIDISLKDKSEDNNTIVYGSIKTSSNWISITDTKTDEFNALKQYLNPPSYAATFQITGEQLREIYSSFDEFNNITGPIVYGANYKPLENYFEHFDKKLFWILPLLTKALTKLPLKSKKLMVISHWIMYY
jgi:putative chitinase